MDDLIKQAEELGLTIDKRWGQQRLQQEIDAALSAPAKEANVTEKLFPVKLSKNYRPIGEFLIEEEVDGNVSTRQPIEDEPLKVMAGTVIHLPIDEARNVMEKKIGERNDPIG